MLEANSAVLIVDVQNDFCPGGNLAVKDGDEVVLPLNQMLKIGSEHGFKLAASRDWHPRKTAHFDKWPIHCVEGTEGARFHSDLKLDGVMVFSKGLSQEDDGYSPFEGVSESGESLTKFLEGINKIYIGGLATDYCVRAAVLDALKLEFDTYVLLDSIKAVDLQDGDGVKALAEMAEQGAKMTTVEEVLNNL